MLNSEFDELKDWMFGSLNNLLSDIESNPNYEIIKMTVGEPTLGPPNFIRKELEKSFSDWGKYPPTEAIPILKKSIMGYLERRFKYSNNIVDENKNILPVPGTREPLHLVGLIAKNKSLKNNVRDIIVAIDAGHGGKDPGAVSSNNVLEKDITLLIAKELQRTLRDTEGYQAVLIRSDDSTVSLNDRYQNARKFGADAFVSIHADGFRLASVKGASVFIWSEESSSSVARNLSDKERKRIQAQIKNLKTYDFNEDAARDLYPNTYKNKIDQSKILGTKILDQLKRDPFTKIHKQNVEYADFRVLKSVDIPSVLVESGFITNPEDAKRLKTKAGRRMIARSIFLGIHNYFKETPVSGSILEGYSNYLNYKIQKGDVLSEIAIRFGVTVESIKKINELGDRPIYPGQIIKINI